MAMSVSRGTIQGGLVLPDCSIPFTVISPFYTASLIFLLTFYFVCLDSPPLSNYLQQAVVRNHGRA